MRTRVGVLPEFVFVFTGALAVSLWRPRYGLVRRIPLIGFLFNGTYANRLPPKGHLSREIDPITYAASNTSM